MMLLFIFSAWAADEPDPRAASAPGRLHSAAAADPDAGLDALVDWLVSDTKDPALRARRIHDWIALNIRYDTASFQAGVRVAPDPGTTLASGTAVCAGYAALFAAMAERAGLEAVVISGYGRGVSRPAHDEVIPAKSNHAWNAVSVDGTWHLLDVTWDSGGMTPTGYRHALSLDYWWPEPEIFAWSHFPTDAAWQLLSPPLEPAAFLAQPDLPGRFGRQLLARTPLHVTTDVGATTEIRLGRLADVAVAAHLTDRDGTRVAVPVLVDRVGDDVRVRASFPAPGTYFLKLYTRAEDEEVGWLVATLGFRASAGSDGSMPTSYGDWSDFEVVSDVPFTGATTRLAVRLPGTSRATLVENGKWTPMTRTGDRFEGDVSGTDWKVVVPGPPPKRKRDAGSAPWFAILAVEPG